MFRTPRRPKGGYLRVHPDDAPGSSSSPRPDRWSWGALLRPLDESLRRTSARPLTPRAVLQLRYYWLDGLFASLSENLWATFVTVFALAYGATSGQIGLLSSVASVAGAVSLLPGARLVERTARPRRLVVLSAGVGGRIPIAIAALLPFVAAAPGAVVACVIVLNALRAFANTFANPAWIAMSAQLVPQDLRGRYFASKNIAMGIAAFGAGPLGGLLIRAGSPGDLGYPMLFGLAFGVGMLATLAFWRIPEPAFHKPDRGDGLRGLLRAVTEVKLFPVFLISGFVWNFAVQVAGPFFTVFMVRKLGAGEHEVGLAAGGAALAALAGQYLAGRIVDRRGSIFVQILTGYIIPLLPVPWIWMNAPWQAVLMMCLGGFFWAGYNLANFNLILELTPDRLRARATAAYQTVVSAGSVLGPLAGGLIVDTVGFAPMFAITAAGRLVGALIFAVGVSASYRAARRAATAR